MSVHPHDPPDAYDPDEDDETAGLVPASPRTRSALQDEGAKQAAKLRRQDAVKLRVIIVLSAMYSLALVVAAILGHSVALLASGFHVLSDTLTYGLALWVHVSANRRRSAKWPYGFARLDVLGGLVIGVSMVAGAVMIFLSALEHLLHLAIHEEGRVEHSLVVLVVAAVGIPFNLLGLLMFHHHGHGHGHSHGSGNHNLTGVTLHLIADAGSAVVIAASAALIHFWSNPLRFYADPVAGLLLAVFTSVINFGLIKDAAQVLVFVNPCGSNADLDTAILQQANVLRVEDLKVWQLDSPMSLVASVRVAIEGGDTNSTLKKVHTLLKAHGIQEATVEVVCEDTDSVCRRLQEANEALREDIGALNKVIGQMVAKKELCQPNQWSFEGEESVAAPPESDVYVETVDMFNAAPAAYDYS